MIEITVNGRPTVVEDGTTVGALVDRRQPRGSDGRRGVAVAVAGRVLPRATWDDTVLAPGTPVEIVTAVQGG